MKIKAVELMDVVCRAWEEGALRQRNTDLGELSEIRYSDAGEAAKKAAAEYERGKEDGRRDGLSQGRDQAFDDIKEIIDKGLVPSRCVKNVLLEKIEEARHPF